MSYAPTLGAWSDWFTPKKWRYIDVWSKSTGGWQHLKSLGPVKQSDTEATATVIDMHEAYWGHAPLVRMFTWDGTRWVQS